jgi:tetratricopeptide (TPR) repeat protein
MYRISIISLFLVTATTAFSQKLPESYYRSQAALENNKVETALHWIDSAIVDSPRQPNIWLKKGEIFYHLNKPDSALKSFYHADKLRNGIASYWIAKYHSLSGDTVNAIAELERHLSSIPKEFEATIQLDTAFQSIRNTEQWQDLWLKQWYNSNELLAADVAYHFSRREWDYAIDILNERMHGRNVRHLFYALRGEAYYNIGSYKAADDDFAQALKRSRRNHSYMAWRGKSLSALSKHRKAIRLLSQAIAQSGGEPEYFMARAKAFASNQELDNALSDINHYLSFYPNCKEGMIIKLDVSLRLKRNIDALLIVNRLIKMKPDNYELYLTRANIYKESKNWEVAEIDYNKAKELGANSKELYLSRGTCRFNQGNSSGACSDWKKAIELGSFVAQELVYKHCP